MGQAKLRLSKLCLQPFKCNEVSMGIFFKVVDYGVIDTSCMFT